MSETDSGRSRLAQQELWRKRLDAAEQVYREAAHELRRALQENNESQTAELSERKAAARLEYRRVLRIFTDLVLRGKPPSSKD